MSIKGDIRALGEHYEFTMDDYYDGNPITCTTCGALVNYQYVDKHLEWHEV